ncbi:hypothetical protein CHS0354_037367 [Potamilus streckersoni]|uniref:Uncharacterized protein n=1 Tax=Potamilus streckersoni TaxID=2493646 RepID=A0AAE0S4M4_9BIVA|nr:hypothetical protein CHS0354_037367 [Potamilus streckersoni]
MAGRLLRVNLRNITRNILSAAVRRTEAASFHCNAICLGDHDAIDRDQPLPYMSVRKAQSRINKAVMHESAPPYQGFIVWISILVFMIYFFILREENDMDELLDHSLTSKLSDLEEHDILKRIHYNRTHSFSTAELEARLHEIQAGKQANRSA